MSALMTGPALAEAVGISYRQLDYWVGEGYLTPADIDGGQRGGTGNWRIFTAPEIEAAKWMAELVKQGIKPSVAGAAGRALAEHGVAQLGMFRITVAGGEQ